MSCSVSPPRHSCTAVLLTTTTVCHLTEKKPNYLKALSNIINKLPKQVQVTELPAVSSLLGIITSLNSLGKSKEPVEHQQCCV